MLWNRPTRYRGLTPPGRPLLLALLLAVTTLGLLPGIPAFGHGEEVDVIIETLERTADGTTVIDYAIALIFLDGEPVTEAAVDATIEPPTAATSTEFTETVPGVYVSRLERTTEGERKVTVSFSTPDTSGSIEFTHRSGAKSNTPFVVIDTAEPHRSGFPAESGTGILGFTSVEETIVSEHTATIITEALVPNAEEPLRVQYSVAVFGQDRQPLDGISVVMSAISQAGDLIGPFMFTSEAGVHTATITFPSAAVWDVTAVIGLDGPTEAVRFTETMPLPYYSDIAGEVIVKYDSERPERIGTSIKPEDSLLATATSGTFADAAIDSGSNEAPTEPKDPAPAVEVQNDQVTMFLRDTRAIITRNVVLRLLHITAIGLWAVPLVAYVFRRRLRAEQALIILGMLATVATGAALSLWGSPLTFPGLLRWSELASRTYGQAYQTSFLAKMGFVALAIIGSAVWTRRKSTSSVAMALTGMALAFVTLTLLAQIHLFAHA